MSKARPKILLEPDDFFALQLSTLANGGIGVGSAFRENYSSEAPNCVIGHAAWLEGRTDAYGAEYEATSMHSRLARAGLTWVENDRAVYGHGRVSFREYIKLLNIDIKESA